jgi:arabinofuranan 3-O-arabinosyltransferase
VLVLGLLAYVPALASSPGRMPADTKLYLYLDPGQLVTDAPWTFDARQFGGWVPHQVISYLWPQGPWYWFWEQLAVPDWIAHRLWIGTLMFAGGLGVRWAARRVGLGVTASLAAALVYQLSPYLLPYVSRTSAMLLPWAGLGWIVGCTVGAATRTRWRDAALIALIVATVGAPNATALIMIAPAPILYLLCAAAQRQIGWRRAISVALRIGVLSLGVSLWWIVMVIIQGRHGADVLAYSESLDAVSLTSTSPEVWRGLGYWLSYVRDPYAATTTASADYMTSGRIIVTGFAIVVIGVLGLVFTRWAHRLFAVALVTTGLVLAVGVHPIDDPSLLMDLLVPDGESGAGLALRSSTRAVPVLVLGVALGAGALVDALGAAVPARHPAWRTAVRLAAGGLLASLAVLYLPTLTGTRLVDPALQRDENPPEAWRDAAAALDRQPDGYRVLQIPGAEFGAFRWGYTVDPPLPGLTERPLVTRDLLPLGSPAAMDLLYAFDERFQSGTVDRGSVAPIARLFGADTIWLANDAAFDRFRTPRPEITHDLFANDAIPGLGVPQTYGAPIENVPDIPIVDELAVSDDRVGTRIPPVELVPVEQPVPVIRAKSTEVLVSGSGDGLVDAAAAGLIDGTELVRYSGSFRGEELTDAVDSASRLIVTDSNRDRAHHWRGSQDVNGYTERGGPDADVLRLDTGDERLPVFGAADATAQTVAAQRGPVRATASAYGEPFAYRPEHRPVMAIDGDPATAWVVGDRGPVLDEYIRLEVDEPIDGIRLRQPDGADAVRHLSEVSITIDERPPLLEALDDRSLRASGQWISLDETSAPATVTIAVTRVAVPDPTPGPALAAVGFAEIDVGLGPTREVVRPPVDAVEALAGAPSAGRPSATIALTRLRTRPTDRWRSDPEPTLVREVRFPSATTVTPQVTVRLDQRASDDTLAELLGITGPRSSARVTGVAAAAGWAAADRDPRTAWITPFGGAEGARLTVSTRGRPIRTLLITQPAGDYSPITSIRVSDGVRSIDLDVPEPNAVGESRIELAEPLLGGTLTLEVTRIEPRITIDRRWAEPVELPAAIAELRPGLVTSVPAALETGCRSDLVTVDGNPVPVAVSGDIAALLAGEPVVATACGTGTLSLAPGGHLLEATAGQTTGLQVDRVVLAEPGASADAEPAPRPTVTVDDSSRTERTVTVGPCPDGCWLVLGEGFHDQWEAQVTSRGRDRDLGAPQLVDGGFNGWRLPPNGGSTTVTLRWTAQRPLTVALGVSALFAVLAIVLAAVDRRIRPSRRARPPRLASPAERATPHSTLVAAAAWIAGAVVIVEPGWVVAAVFGASVLYITGRPRLAGLIAAVGLVVIAGVIAYVVHDERPFPDAGWPGRFEWLHGLGLFAAVSLLVSALGVPPRRRTRP